MIRELILDTHSNLKLVEVFKESDFQLDDLLSRLIYASRFMRKLEIPNLLRIFNVVNDNMRADRGINYGVALFADTRKNGNLIIEHAVGLKTYPIASPRVVPQMGIANGILTYDGNLKRFQDGIADSWFIDHNVVWTRYPVTEEQFQMEPVGSICRVFTLKLTGHLCEISAIAYPRV